MMIGITDDQVPWLIFGGLFLLIALCLIKPFLKTKRIIEQGHSTMATVVDSVAGQPSEIGPMSTEAIHHAVFEYTVGGVRYKKKNNFSQNPPKYHVGQKVELYYDPLNPNKATLKGHEKIIAVLLIIFGVLGVGLLLIGLMV